MSAINHVFNCFGSLLFVKNRDPHENKQTFFFRVFSSACRAGASLQLPKQSILSQDWKPLWGLIAIFWKLSWVTVKLTSTLMHQ